MATTDEERESNMGPDVENLAADEKAEKDAQDNMHQAVTHVRSALRLLNLDLEENYVKTPIRWVRFLQEFNKPLDVEEILSAKTKVPDRYHSMLVQSDIPFRAVCAHHLVPVLGRAHIGYVPKEWFIGLSKLTRLIDAVSCQRPSIQELVCDEVADLLMTHLHCAGAMVVIQAEHGCMACRGVKEAGVITSTSAVRGIFRDVPHARQEFFQLIAKRKDL